MHCQHMLQRSDFAWGIFKAAVVQTLYYPTQLSAKHTSRTSYFEYTFEKRDVRSLADLAKVSWFSLRVGATAREGAPPGDFVPTLLRT